MLPGCRLVEWSGLWGELDVDGLAVDLIGPFEIGAMPFGRIAMAGALRPAALHHPFQDGSLQEEFQLEEFPLSDVEALRGGSER
jgi:hypothetical protein